MGCGESKHDVTTGNTISHRKKLSLRMKRRNTLEAIPESDVMNEVLTNSLLQQPEFNNTDKDLVVALADVKDITVNTELNDAEIEDPGDQKEDVFVGKFISLESPNHFFSSRKDEDAIEAIVAEDRLEYFSPHHQPSQEVEWIKASEKPDNVVEEKGLVDDEEEKRAETQNGKAEDLKEAILIKEAKVVTPIEDKKSLVGVEV